MASGSVKWFNDSEAAAAPSTKGATSAGTASCTAATRHMRGMMLWFNADKDLGALRTEDDERLEVPGSAFAAGGRPEGRCVGKVVEFRATEGEGGIAAEEIVFVPEVAQRRARRRHRR